ncbi:hypothetical protein [Campylobacter hyointestinalis]|uniref:hypothetical protein n=1 Tax=Campylobacter hyointestinalis TaxID=198 RepID=UPI00072B1EC8|nr:hypothetical protein [Campylobacter hyointestinalis]CUU91972.1 Uncharacterised protein [Campylobacter hyointestinalis subsp. hyointestinalis]
MEEMYKTTVHTGHQKEEFHSIDLEKAINFLKDKEFDWDTCNSAQIELYEVDTSQNLFKCKCLIRKLDEEDLKDLKQTEGIELFTSNTTIIAKVNNIKVKIKADETVIDTLINDEEFSNKFVELLNLLK